MDFEETKPARRPWWALVVAAAAVAAVAAVLLAPGWTASTSDSAAHAEMLAVAPGGEVALADLPAELAGLYEAAHADREGFASVTCYCGCEEFLAHRGLLDCFLRPGGGWERHAVGCAVCQQEARDVIDLRRQGVPLEDIVRQIDARYGDITATA